MSITQIGSRIVKQICSGDSFRKIVTEVVDGKTYTRCYNSAGDLLLDRVKAISKYKVGDKNVTTITKVIKEPDKDIEKLVIDRVNNADGKYLGLRGTNYRFEGGIQQKISSFKQGRGTLRMLKNFYPNGIVGSKQVSTTFLGVIKRRPDSACIIYNNKGLPMPERIGYDKCTDMSLQEMRNLHLMTNPQESYVPSYYGLRFLDVRQPGDKLAKMSDLDRFI